MSNIINFQKPANQKKPNNSLAKKIMVATIILLAIIKLPELMTPSIYREHSVQIFSNPIKVPANYIVYDLSGREHKLSEEMGDKITVFAFWATWCGYCKKELPEMDEVIPELAKHGVTIVPIARGDDTPEKVSQFLQRSSIHNVESTIASTSELHKVLGVNGYPTFIAVDENGMAFAKLRPDWSASNLSEMFDKLGRKGELK